MTNEYKIMFPLHHSIRKKNYKCFAELLNDVDNINMFGTIGTNDITIGIINTKDADGNTPLHIAVDEFAFSYITLLLKHNVIIDTKNNNGETPLHLAIFKYNIRVCKILLESGTNVNKRWRGKTPLHLAINHSCIEITALLIEYGADIFIKSSKVSPIYLINCIRDPDIVKYVSILYYCGYKYNDVKKYKNIRRNYIYVENVHRAYLARCWSQYPGNKFLMETNEEKEEFEDGIMNIFGENYISCIKKYINNYINNEINNNEIISLEDIPSYNRTEYIKEFLQKQNDCPFPGYMYLQSIVNGDMIGNIFDDKYAENGIKYINILTDNLSYILFPDYF